MLAYRSQFGEAEQELAISTAYWQKTNDTQGLTLVWLFRALRALLLRDASAALVAARKAREFAEEQAKNIPVERDFIRSEWLIGAALTLTLTRSQNQRTGEGTFAEAEKHLQDALSRDRKIGLVDHEAAILLEWAKLRFAEARIQKSEDRKKQLIQESLDFANEALEIAERCEYRLQEAEIQNFLAEWWKETSEIRRQTSDKTAYAEAIAKAKQHAERAKECAWCDGPPYHYKVAYEQAERMITKLDKETL